VLKLGGYYFWDDRYRHAWCFWLIIGPLELEFEAGLRRPRRRSPTTEQG